jgi:NTE family protein
MIEIDEWIPPDHMIIIVVNAETTHDPAFDLSKAAPGLVSTMNLVSGAQIRRINFDTLDLIDSAARDWARELSGPNHEVTAHVVEVSFDHVRDEKARTYLERLPTSFSLSEEQVDRLIEAGRKLLRESPQYQEVLEQFDGDRN